MRNRPKIKPIVVLSSLIVAFLVAGFFLVDTYLARTSADAETQDERLSYHNHDIDSALTYRSDYVGDQGNTFSLLASLPLADKTALMSVVNDGVRIELEDVTLADTSVKRDMVYSAAVIMTIISDVDSVEYATMAQRAELTRAALSARLGVVELGGDAIQNWESVRSSIPDLAEASLTLEINQ